MIRELTKTWHISYDHANLITWNIDETQQFATEDKKETPVTIASNLPPVTIRKISLVSSCMYTSTFTLRGDRVPEEVNRSTHSFLIFTDVQGCVSKFYLNHLKCFLLPGHRWLVWNKSYNILDCEELKGICVIYSKLLYQYCRECWCSLPLSKFQTTQFQKTQGRKNVLGTLLSNTSKDFSGWQHAGLCAHTKNENLEIRIQQLKERCVRASTIREFLSPRKNMKQDKVNRKSRRREKCRLQMFYATAYTKEGSGRGAKKKERDS